MVMNIVKRALLYLSRKKARSLILFVMMLVMGLFLMVGISIRFSARKAAEDVRKSITTGITIKLIPVDGNAILNVVINENGEKERIPKVPLLKRSMLSQLLEVEGVEGYYTDVGCDILYTGFDLRPGFYTETIDEFRKTGDKKEIKISETYMHANAFYEVFDGSWHPHFANGALELTRGRHIQSEDKGKAVISEELAERNDLQIGDQIKAYQYDFLTGELYGSPYEAEIVGLFQVNFEQAIGEYTSESDIIYNVIFVGYDARQWAQKVHNIHVGRDVISDKEDRFIDNITLFVEDPQILDSVKEQIEQIDTVDWSYYQFERYDRDYQAAAKPLLTIIRLSTLMAVVMAAGVLIILSLLLTMWIRGRSREAGILASLGVKKRKMVAQFLIEAILIAAAAFVFAGVLAKPVTDAMGHLMSNAANQTLGEEPYEVEFDAGSGDIIINKTPTEPVALEYHLTWPIMLFVFMAMLLVVMAAVLASSRSILRQKPMDVLRGG